jgi:hypothetical protein
MKYNGLRSLACKRRLQTYYLAAKLAAQEYPTIMNDNRNIQWLIWDVEDSVIWSAWAREALNREVVLKLPCVETFGESFVDAGF